MNNSRVGDYFCSWYFAPMFVVGEDANNGRGGPTFTETCVIINALPLFASFIAVVGVLANNNDGAQFKVK